MSGDRGGFSLVQFLIAVAIMAVILAVGVLLSKRLLKGTDSGLAQGVHSSDFELVRQTMTRDIQNAYPIVGAANHEASPKYGIMRFPDIDPLASFETSDGISLYVVNQEASKERSYKVENILTNLGYLRFTVEGDFLPVLPTPPGADLFVVHAGSIREFFELTDVEFNSPLSALTTGTLTSGFDTSGIADELAGPFDLHIFRIDHVIYSVTSFNGVAGLYRQSARTGVSQLLSTTANSLRISYEFGSVTGGNASDCDLKDGSRWISNPSAGDDSTCTWNDISSVHLQIVFETPDDNLDQTPHPHSGVLARSRRDVFDWSVIPTQFAQRRAEVAP